MFGRFASWFDRSLLRLGSLAVDRDQILGARLRNGQREDPGGFGGARVLTQAMVRAGVFLSAFTGSIHPDFSVVELAADRAFEHITDDESAAVAVCGCPGTGRMGATGNAVSDLPATPSIGQEKTGATVSRPSSAAAAGSVAMPSPRASRAAANIAAHD